MINHLLIFIVALLAIVKSATMATKYAARLAESFSLSKYTVGFIVVAIISILPETFVAINAALEGIPSFGLGTLFGSNVADLTLVFAIIVLFAGRGMKVEGKILTHHAAYPFILLLPLALGFNGHFSRAEGVALIIAGGVFYYTALRNGNDGTVPVRNGRDRYVSVVLLLVSVGVLLTAAHFIVTSVTGLASYFGINPVLIGMLVVGLGTTIPELFFAMKSVERRDDSLAVGDILGTVLADATIVVGILALLNPFSFPQKIIFVTGVFMVVASFTLFHFMRTGRTLVRKEAYALLLFWLMFAVVEFVVNR